ncbi:hypothetical protein GQ457_10G006990 [Hibiscus cannabinus]
MFFSTCNVEECRDCVVPMDVHERDVTSSGLQGVFSGETSILHVKNELDLYLDEGVVTWRLHVTRPIKCFLETSKSWAIMFVLCLQDVVIIPFKFPVWIIICLLNVLTKNMELRKQVHVGLLKLGVTDDSSLTGSLSQLLWKLQVPKRIPALSLIGLHVGTSLPPDV